MTTATPRPAATAPRRFYEAEILSDDRLARVVLVVSLLAALLIAAKLHGLPPSLGDTDDAMRLVRVRDLAAGQGWYDQSMRRLQPPLGSEMHWSRLVDAGEAGALLLFRTVLSPAPAETVLRWVWPLVWIAPATAAALVMARRLAGGVAVFAAAVILLATAQLFVQFAPGRLDHHNIQIACALVAAAAAMEETRRRAPVAGAAATALGLAVGLEALPFHGLIAGAVLLRAALQPEHRSAGIRYGVTLAGTTLALFLLQTPPNLWTVARCDALSQAQTAPILLAGLGAAAALILTRGLGPTGRVLAVAAPGIAAGLLYVLIRPQCLRGPIGEVDPRLFPFWFAHIDELQPLPEIFAGHRVLFCAVLLTAVAGIGASLFRVWRQRRSFTVTDGLAAGLAVIAAVGACKAVRMNDYAGWFAIPVLAAVAVDLGRRFRGRPALAALMLALGLSPGMLAAAAVRLPGIAPPVGGAQPADAAPDLAGAGGCEDTASYAGLARLPAGTVAAPIDLGPFILANTAHSVLSAPYHRMTWGILAAQDILQGDGVRAEARARAAGVRYVVDCPSGRTGGQAGSLVDALRRGGPPDWLALRSAPGATLRVYEVRAPRRDAEPASGRTGAAA